MDYIGALTDGAFSGKPAQSSQAAVVEADLPPVDEELFEWIDVLEAVRDASEVFTMLEFGAGYGRWGVRGWLAARAYGIERVRLGLVEAEPRHIEFLRRHLRDNGVPLACVDVDEGVVSDEPGETYLYVYAMSGDGYTPENWYGQFKAQPDLEPIGIAAGAYYGRDLYAFATNYAAIKVRQLPAREIVRRYALVDLLDMDVQGEELTVVQGCVDDLNDRVRRLHIGTHAPAIEDGLRAILSAQGWECLRDYRCNGTSATPYGAVTFQDGVQTWRNPRL